MYTKTAVVGTRCTPYASLRTVIFTALIAMAPVVAIADQPPATASPSRVADVPLADLDLATPDGMRVARERLHTMAEHICAGPENRGRSSQPHLVACVEGTVASALGGIRMHQNDATVRNSVTRAANVSLADLDLSTVEGSRVARERLEAMARRLCSEVARSNYLSYRANWVDCVHDTTAGAMAQAKVLAAEKQTRIARRLAP